MRDSHASGGSGRGHQVFCDLLERALAFGHQEATVERDITAGGHVVERVTGGGTRFVFLAGPGAAPLEPGELGKALEALSEEAGIR